MKWNVSLRELLAIVVLPLVLGTSTANAQRAAKPRADIELPPMSYTCPMHPDVLEADPGPCPICKMNLVAVRLVSIWTCPVHSVITEQKAGKCPIDHRDLIQVTVALSWTCTGRSDVNQLTPGKCPDGTDTLVKYTPRPHGNHNPQHGGQFFMAPDNWHHLEGALPRAGFMRVYLYDDFSKPLPLDQARRVQGRIVTNETIDPQTRMPTEVAFPLSLTRDGRAMEARVDARTLPARLTAKLKFKSDGPEYRFDFAFDSFSKDPVTAVATTAGSTSKGGGTTTRTPATKGTPGAPSTAIATITTAGSDANTSNPDFNAAGNPNNQIEVAIPDTVEEMVRAVSTRNERIRDLIERGSFAEIYVPAFEAKELALAIDAHSAQLEPKTQATAQLAVKQLVRSAWLLDSFGDLGNRAQIVEAYQTFGAAVSILQELFPTAK